ncbi:hypothetical protein R75461_07182 [Paraburkholderia nemoris]|nr:hypothetical protein R75461_07182 [Paraburkholderia nemoris]
MVATLPGEFGRVVGQFTAGVMQTATTIEGLIGAGAQARESVAAGSTGLLAAASASNWSGMSDAA